MAVVKVDIMVSEILVHLNNGMTWLKKDDVGYGSIEAKYGATPVQIAMIRKHPKLKDVEPNIVLFNIIDDVVSIKTEPEPTAVAIAEKPSVKSAEPNVHPVMDNILSSFINL